jgi:putative solute:sodium symporter small subunit
MYDRDPSHEYQVNPFRPKKGYMLDEMAVIIVILVGWSVVNFGFQILLWLTGSGPGGEGLLTRLTVPFLSFPVHFWFTSQLLPLWFIILCIIFNLYIDRLTERHSRKRDRTYE